MTVRRFCTFRIDGLTFGVDVTRIEEVLWATDMTPVPLAHPAVAGLLNLRGEIVTVIDGRRRFDVAPRPDDQRGVHVILHSGQESVSLLVDSEGDVIDIADDAWEAVPGTVPPAIRAHSVGAHPSDEYLLLELDPDSALALTTT